MLIFIATVVVVWIVVIQVKLHIIIYGKYFASNDQNLLFFILFSC